MDRRSLLTGGGTLLVAVALSEDAGARATRVPATPADARFMQLAIDQAKEGDYPFGAIIVRGESVLSLGRNATKRAHDPTAHAAMVAIRSFLNGHEPDDFKTTTIYVSSEPCPMCMGAILWCGFERLVYGASISQISEKTEQIAVSAQQIAKGARFTNIGITSGVMAEDALKMFEPKPDKK